MEREILEQLKKQNELLEDIHKLLRFTLIKDYSGENWKGDPEFEEWKENDLFPLVDYVADIEFRIVEENGNG